MRRSFIALLALVLMLPAATAAAQEQQEAGENEANLYVATVYVNRVYTHRLGYKVLYQQQDLSLGEVYLPNSWFSKAAGRAELINTRSTAAPYMEIYYNNGEFAYVRLYVRRNPNHVSWGSLRPGEAPEEAFDQETLNISY